MRNEYGGKHRTSIEIAQQEAKNQVHKSKTKHLLFINRCFSYTTVKIIRMKIRNFVHLKKQNIYLIK